jgi:diguanylate cyclase
MKPVPALRAATNEATARAARAPWQTLKLRLALMGVVLIALAVALTVGLTLSTAGQRSEQLALDLSLAQTRKLAKLVSSRLVEMQLSLRAAADEMDTNAIDTPAAMRFLERRTVLSRQFDSVFLATPDGRVLAMRDQAEPYTPQPALNIADRSYFQQTMAQQRPIVSEPIRARTTQGPALILTFPVRAQDGRIAAVLAGGLRLSSHRLLADVVDVDEDDPARTVVIDARGRIVAHSEADWLLRDAAEEPTLAAAVARWVQAGRPIEPSGDAARLDSRLVTSAGVPDAEWVVFRSADEAAVLAGVAQARVRAIKVGAVVAAAGGVALLLATGWLLWPLRRLERVAESLARGEVPAPSAWPRAQGEIGQLAAVLRQALEAREAADADSRRALALLQAVMAHAPVGFGFTRGQRFEMVSAHFERLLGYAPGQLDGEPPRLIYASDAFYEELGPRVGAAFASRQAFDEEVELVRRDGSRFWGRLKGQPVQWDDAAAGTIWTLEDVTDQRAHRQSLAWASSHDALTALVNRAEFERRLGQRIDDRRDVPVAALFIDLDRFKAVNDSAGHAAGDAVLVAVARALEHQVRLGDTVARLGGDEFAVLLPGCPREGAVRVAEGMRAAIDAIALPWGSHTLGVGASIGVVLLEPGLPDVAAVMAAADAACYAVKRSGRNGVRVHGQADLRLVGE